MVVLIIVIADDNNSETNKVAIGGSRNNWQLGRIVSIVDN